MTDLNEQNFVSDTVTFYKSNNKCGLYKKNKTKKTIVSIFIFRCTINIIGSIFVTIFTFIKLEIIRNI